ncbi:DEAD/DEAH box helicase [Novosphingobium mathurense]|uniref:Helicase conserved C-terminal domain-containing protein n=1 Tax=Novosphingobium mathurense TaxID=428990 RepID=A0A1U6H600_9SPHN|nr:DEAD/DEAH box helicase [Novosphingobium mathurense]SLJ91188.1 Helicase conserved C-terminal domain-containing protein [Novosphingobium mathurense]
MASSPEAIAALIRETTAPGFRDDLLAKGQARSMIWRGGALPADAPPFSRLLSYDLLAYAYTLMTQGLRLLDVNAERETARMAFESAASAIEAVIARGPASDERDFHRLIAGACYHLARYAARAFSLLHQGLNEANLTLPEKCLALLMLRDIEGLHALVGDARLGALGSEDSLIEILATIEAPLEFDDGEEEPEEKILDVVDMALADHFLGAMGIALLAFERGERELLDAALARLKVGLGAAGDLNLVPHWWCHRLAIHLLGDLWSSSFHERLPLEPPNGEIADWADYRELFIATLLRRDRAEIDLWPSQLEAADRALDLAHNMVVSLPTSAGKTRIAELCILACLAAGRRVVFVTPLRALSAQTEVTLQRTFRPLGKTVSSLYGAIGVSEVDEDFLRDSSIIVATPEKLDFALRNDPDLLNDVGLVVLDEGHMIGLTEREVRYEVQIQRLLRRSDAADRRIVCLSAILPDGKQLEDFTAWLTCDHPSGLVKKDWRPTRLRFGEVVWRGDHARLDISVGAEQPWIETFITPTLPKGRKTRLFPCDQRELCIATAWTLVADAHSVLIFCPLRKSVEPFARVIVDLAKRGALPSVLNADPAVLDNALAIGAEWLGTDSPILKCLKLGVAIHHGALPTAFRKEVERLLREGILKVTISSPTLAQGLNLSATTLIFHGLERNRQDIDIAEFRNVVGRAGRAYVDVEGLVLMPMFDKIKKRRAAWNAMITNAKGKEMESGLLRLVLTLMQRMVKKHRPKSVDAMIEYLAGTTVWDFPALADEGDDEADAERSRWAGFLTTLDTAILSLLGEREVEDDAIETALDEVLTSSLWSRRLATRRETGQQLLKAGLTARARYIWSQTTATHRRGYFLAGVGLATGKALDAHAAHLNQCLVNANGAILLDNAEQAIAAITEFAETAFTIAPFIPENLPDNWRDVLRAWLEGDAIVSLASDDESEVLQFVEQALVYRLPWAMEAVRVRAIASGDTLGDGFLMDDAELGLAVAAVETGTLNRSAAVLIHAGFSSRLGALSAATETGADFTDMAGLRMWLRSDEVESGSIDPDWPTPQSHSLWLQFVESLAPERQRTWSRHESQMEVRWDDVCADAGAPVRLYDDGSRTLVLDTDFTRLGRLKTPINPKRLGLVQATVGFDEDFLDVRYLGPADLTRRSGG